MSKHVIREFFTRSEPVKNPLKWEEFSWELHVARSSPSTKNTMMKSDFCPRVTGNPNTVLANKIFKLHLLAVLANKIRCIVPVSNLWVVLRRDLNPIRSDG